MAKRTVACALVWQLVMPVAPLVADTPTLSGGVPFWVNATLVSVDVPQRRVSFRLTTGDLRMATVASDSALRRLTGYKEGELLKLNCTEHAAGEVVVYEAKKAKGGNWWKRGVLTAVGFILVLGVIGALTAEPCDGYCG